MYRAGRRDDGFGRERLQSRAEIADQSGVSSIPFRSVLPGSRAAPYAVRPLAFFADAVAGWLVRPRRVLLVLSVVWVINLFDLGFTLTESQRHNFRELNPLAASLLHSSPSLVLYKAVLVLVGSSILLLHSRQRVTEIATWLVFAIYGYVGCCWWLYYEHIVETLSDPAVTLPALAN